MVIEKIPNYVNAAILAKQESKVTGYVFVKELESIVGLVQPSCFDNQAVLTINFTIDLEHKLLVAEGEVTVTLDLICERCLEVSLHPIKSEFTLALIVDEKSAKKLPEIYEPCVLETDGKRVNLYKLLEEEILLSMPIVAMHPVGVCAMPSSLSLDN